MISGMVHPLFETIGPTTSVLVQGTADHDVTLIATIVGVVVLVAAILFALLGRRARQKMSEVVVANARYREMAEAMPQIVWTATPDGRVDYFNRRWFEYTGLGPGTQGDERVGVIHPDDAQASLDQWNAAVAKTAAYDMEYRIRRASDGEFRWHIARAVPLRDSDGAVLTWFGTLTDIEEQKRAEEILRKNQITLEHRIEEREADAERATALYQLLAENATDMVSTHHPNGAYEYATPSWIEYLGESPVGKYPAEFSHPGDIEALQTNHKLGLQLSGAITTVWRCRRAEGTYGWVETRTRAVRNPVTDRVITFVCATRDVTERRRLEQEFVLLHEIVLAVSTASTLEDALRITLHALCEATGWGYGEAWIPNGDSSRIERSAVWYARQGLDVTELLAASEGMSYRSGESVVGRSWKDARVVWVRDTKTDTRVVRAAVAAATGLGAGVAVPVIAEGVVVAVLCFMMTEPVHADEARVEFVSVAAAQLGALIARKQVANEFGKERLFLTALFDSLSEGIVAIDPAGKLRMTNRMAREQIGDMGENRAVEHAAEAFNLYRLDGVTHLATDELPLVRVMNGIDVRDEEFVARPPGGVQRTLSANGQLIVDDAGEKLGAVIAMRDITQIKRDEIALRESEDKYRQLVEQAADAILLVEADGRCGAANTRAGRLVGVPPEEMLGEMVNSFLTPVAQETGTPSPVPGAEVVAAEYTIRHVDGYLVPVEVSTATLADGRVQIIARDISGRKELERLKDEFTSVVSHELRTPLTSIRGSLGLLASGQLANAPEKGQRMLDLAVANTDRLIRLINDILDVERINSGIIAMELEWCDGSDITRSVVEAMRPVADRGGVTLLVRGSRLRLWADPDRITQTLTNLVGNAIKFSPSGATVEVSFHAKDGNAMFEVRDRGRGIPPDKLETVFERFQQVDASDARDKGGTGLGLAICRGIVRQHGGRIWAENRINGGTSFKFTLPLRADYPHTGRTPSISMEAVHEHVMHILVIEDDVALAQVIALALEGYGFTVDIAHDGASALERYEAAGADVLIVDLALPDADGLDVIDRIRSTAGAPRARTIIYTASDPSADVRERIRGMGAELATKGRVSTEALVERVIRLIESPPIDSLEVT
ncbi:MAG TPA: PAS domain S-box protein [Gemmatimonadaceae bacterium]|nr:PAS domain S-box protein [Gemmatimonadaceae bacterium]